MDIIYVCVYVYARIKRNAKEDVNMRVSAGVIVITLRYHRLAVPSSLFVPVLS